MSPSKLRTLVAILATVAGFSALAGTAGAQISGTTGGDVVARDPTHVPAGPTTHLGFAVPWGIGQTNSRLTDTLHVGPAFAATGAVTADAAGFARA